MASRQTAQDAIITLIIGASIGAWIVSAIENHQSSKLKTKLSACTKAYEELTSAASQASLEGCPDQPAVVRLLFEAGKAKHLIQCVQTNNGDSTCSVSEPKPNN